MPKQFSENKKLEWKSLIEQQRQSGLSVRNWCQKQNLVPNTFHYWSAKLFPKELQTNSFVELKARSDEVSLQTRGLHIRVGSDCDPALRKQLLAFFVEAAC